MALSLVPYDIFKSLKGKGFRKGKWDGKRAMEFKGQGDGRYD